MRRDLGPLDNPCKLYRMGRTNLYVIDHCEHIRTIGGVDKVACCGCEYSRPFIPGAPVNYKCQNNRHGNKLEWHMSKLDDKASMTGSDESEHEKLVKRAKDAIRDITTDHNVTLEHSIMSLRQLKFYIDGQLDQLENGL